MSKEPDQLQELEDKISKAKSASAPKPTKSNEYSGAHAGFEFALSILISSVIGYGLDGFLGTSPALLIVFFFLGVATGFYGLYRFSQKSSKN